MTIKTVKLPSATMGYHPRFPPSGAKKPYTARITGREKGKLRFKRDFIGGAYDAVTVADAGLYEIRSALKKGGYDDVYRIVVEHSGALVALDVIYDNVDGADGDATVATIAKALDAGIDITDLIEVVECEDGSAGYSLRTAAQAKKARAAATVAQAVSACAAILSDLSPADRKRAMAELRAVLAPTSRAVTSAVTAEESAAHRPLELDSAEVL